MHKVKCPICGLTFDRDIVSYVEYGARRYAHAECCPDKQAIIPTPPQKQPTAADQEKEDLKNLKDYIKQVYNDNVNWPLVASQIKQYKENYHYTYSGMLGALIWYFEVKGYKYNGGTNIGFLPLIYTDAKDYYQTFYQARELNATKNIKEYIPQIECITIPSPRTWVKPHRLFNMEDEE